MTLDWIIECLEMLEWRIRQPNAVVAPPGLRPEEWAYVCGLAGGRLLGLISDLKRERDQRDRSQGPGWS